MTPRQVFEHPTIGELVRVGIERRGGGEGWGGEVS